MNRLNEIYLLQSVQVFFVVGLIAFTGVLILIFFFMELNPYVRLESLVLFSDLSLHFDKSIKKERDDERNTLIQFLCVC